MEISSDNFMDVKMKFDAITARADSLEDKSAEIIFKNEAYIRTKQELSRIEELEEELLALKKKELLSSIKDIASLEELDNLKLDEDLKELDDIKKAIKDKQEEIFIGIERRIGLANEVELIAIEEELGESLSLRDREDFKKLIADRRLELDKQAEDIEGYGNYLEIEEMIVRLDDSLLELAYMIELGDISGARIYIDTVKKDKNEIDTKSEEYGFGNMTERISSELSKLEDLIVDIDAGEFRKKHMDILNKNIDNVLIEDRKNIETSLNEYESLLGLVQSKLIGEKNLLDSLYGRIVELEKIEEQKEKDRAYEAAIKDMKEKFNSGITTINGQRKIYISETENGIYEVKFILESKKGQTFLTSKDVKATRGSSMFKISISAGIKYVKDNQLREIEEYIDEIYYNGIEMNDLSALYNKAPRNVGQAIDNEHKIRIKLKDQYGDNREIEIELICVLAE